MIVHTMPQRSPEWHQIRVGKFTASRAADMLATIKSGEAATRRDLRVQLVCERLTGVCQENGFVNADMQRGIDKEADALAAYEIASGHMVMPVGFCAHNTLPAGCSPDGQIDDFAGLLELKCPKSATHLAYLKAQKVPKDYLPQIVHALWITGAQWCDFCSFDDRFPEPLQLFRVRVQRVEVDIASYEIMVRSFLAEIETECEAVNALAAF